ncbi:MAG: twin-arginine translocase TatA/TatE family subunit [bacterium JZ-2024 1]
MLRNIGITELILILFIILLVFGGYKKIPELARGLGQAITEFRKGLRGEVGDEKNQKKSE